MSDPNLSSPTPTPSPASSSELGDLKELCADLRWQVHTLRIALLVVACALAGFFWLEVRRNDQALKALRPQAAQVIEAGKVQDPIAGRFVGQLLEFGKTHADFAAILNKYGVRGTSAPPPTAMSPIAPAPGVPKK